jgi:hypothetical protein
VEGQGIGELTLGEIRQVIAFRDLGQAPEHCPPERVCHLIT